MAFLDNSTTMLLTPNPASIGTTSVGGTTAVVRFVIKDNKGELEFDPKKVSTTLVTTTSSSVATPAIINHNNQEYQRYLNQLKQANVVRDIDEMLAAESPEYLDALLAMIDEREQELASLEQQEEKVHVKHL